MPFAVTIDAAPDVEGKKRFQSGLCGTLHVPAVWIRLREWNLVKRRTRVTSSTRPPLGTFGAADGE